VNHQSTICERELSYSAPKQHAKYWVVSVCHQCIQLRQLPSTMEEIVKEKHTYDMGYGEYFQKGNINVD
jgi:hypothetical protein